MRRDIKTRGEYGYTFTESIFQLVILIAFVHLLLLFFLWKGTIEHHYANYSSTQWDLFVADLNLLLSDVTDIQILGAGRSIRLRNGRGLIDIEQSGTVIRK